MMFREKGKKILCLRSEYMPASKRTKSVTVASLDRWQSTVPDNIRRLLTEKEVDSLESWLIRRTEKRSIDSLKSSLSTVAYDVGRATEALSDEQAVSNFSQRQAELLFDEITKLRRALKKAGFSPSKENRSNSNSAPANQSAMF